MMLLWRYVAFGEQLCPKGNGNGHGGDDSNMGYAIAAILAILLIGQCLSHIGDARLSVHDPRPIGGRTVEVTILWWGLAARQSRKILVDDCANLGINDMRFFVTPRQLLLSLVTLGLVRKVHIHYRCYAGDSDVGDA